MKITISLIGLIYGLCISSSTNMDVWANINEKTWFAGNNWAGEQIVFYKTKNGLEKAIWQLHGSGVYVTMSVIYDVEIMQDTIYLREGLDLIDGHIMGDLELIYLKDTTLVSNNNNLKFKIISSEPSIYNWQGNYRGGEIIQIEMFKNIPIQKKQIYSNIKQELKKN